MYEKGERKGETGDGRQETGETGDRRGGEEEEEKSKDGYLGANKHPVDARHLQQLSIVCEDFEFELK